MFLICSPSYVKPPETGGIKPLLGVPGLYRRKLKLQSLLVLFPNLASFCLCFSEMDIVPQYFQPYAAQTQTQTHSGSVVEFFILWLLI